jgi:hypothetical protein
MTSEAKLDYVVATHLIENIVPSTEVLSLCTQRNNGTISLEDALRMIRQKYGIEDK